MTGEADRTRHRDYVRCNTAAPPCTCPGAAPRPRLTVRSGTRSAGTDQPVRGPGRGTLRATPPSRASTPRWRRAIRSPIRSTASEPIRHGHGLHGQREHAGRGVVAGGGAEESLSRRLGGLSPPIRHSLMSTGLRLIPPLWIAIRCEVIESAMTCAVRHGPCCESPKPLAAAPFRSWELINAPSRASRLAALHTILRESAPERSARSERHRCYRPVRPRK